jgi:ABC-type transport system involved in multi-copper enzyme maturation permease subunit
MRTLIDKELRLLLPAFAGALALAILPVWIVPYDKWNPSVLPSYLYLFGTVLLALSSFGREIGLRTLPFMLAQPLERARIWWTKIIVLAVFAALTYDAWWLSGSLRSILRPALSLRLDELALFGLMAVVFVAGGLWMTLWLRHTVAAFLLSLLLPIAVISAIEIIGGADWVCIAALGLYAVAGFFLARRQFLHAQDTAWTGGVLSFGRARATGEQASLREHRPWAALLRKELQLQQVTLLGMAGLLVLHLGVMLVRKAGAQVLGRSILSALEMFGWLWLMVPWLVGGQSVADERQLGTLDGLLSLPFSRRLQFSVKLIIVLVLGGLLSEALLFTAEGVGSAMGAGAKLDVMGIDFTGHGLISVSFAFLVLSLLGFYASTLTRGMVSALAAGAVLSVVFWMLFLFAHSSVNYFGWRLWPVMAEPTLAAAVIWLAYGNFRYVFESGRRWRRNILGLIALLVVVNGSVAAVYHRAWEFAMPLEGSHGPARLPAGKYLCLHNYGSSSLAVLLPDGRLWQGIINERTGRPSAVGNHLAAGSNWVAASSNGRETLAIRSDGTLWVSEPSERPLLQGGPWPFVQIGVETNWQSVACAAGSMVALLKRDGTLWRLEKESPLSNTYVPLRALTPHRLGETSDWARILQGNPWIYAWKRDGTAWNLHEAEFNKAGRLLKFGVELDPVTRANPQPALDHMQFQSLNTCPIFPESQVGLRDDGTLWHLGSNPRAVRQIGHDTNWAAETFGSSQLVALKTDGSIWEWKFDFRRGPMDQKLQEAPVRLGTHKDWVALGSWLRDPVFLAADGTLWRWSQSDRPYWLSPEREGEWLAPSRRPAKLENILGSRE